METSRNSDAPAPRALSTKDRVRLYLNYELDKRLAGLAMALYCLTGRRLFRLWKVKVLILTTRGRKSDKTRNALLQYFPDGANMVVAAANSGRSANPGWFYNLMTTPEARVQVDGRSIEVQAVSMSEEEATKFWPQLLRIAPTYERYRQATARRIPLIRLVPILPTGLRKEPSGETTSRRA